MQPIKDHLCGSFVSNFLMETSPDDHNQEESQLKGSETIYFKVLRYFDIVSGRPKGGACIFFKVC